MKSEEIPSIVLVRHETLVWEAIVEATAAVEGNQLRAEVDRSGVTHLPVVAVLDSARLNRVIMPEALIANYDELNRVSAFYSRHAQAHFAIELPSEITTTALASWLLLHGLIEHGGRMVKMVRPISEMVRKNDLPTVIELGPSDREAWIAVSRDAWNVPRLMSPWFGSTFGASDVRHFGVVDGDELAAIGALHVSGELAWIGLDATRPNYRGRGMQLALLAHRLGAVAECGCRWAHAETFLGKGEATNPSLRNMLRVGFVRLHDRVIYEPAHGIAGQPSVDSATT